MQELPTYFKDFIAKIRLRPDLREALQEAHQDVTGRLERDTTLRQIVRSTFLQGSYRRATIIDPEGNDPADVDVVVVTNLPELAFPNPGAAMDKFVPFLERNYPNQWRRQARSFGITMGQVDLDLVITSDPGAALQVVLESAAVRSRLDIEDDPDLRFRSSWVPPGQRTTPNAWRQKILTEGLEKQPWRDTPLRIPDRELRVWEDTHPLAQIEWTAEKNARCMQLYLDVVRAIKWWRRRTPTPKYPKGYPVEHMVGAACPDMITSTAEGVVRTMEGIVAMFEARALQGERPYLKDHGVNQNVLGRVDLSDFLLFLEKLKAAARIARQAYDAGDKHTAVQLWQKLFGARFPDPPEWGRGGRGSAPAAPAGGFTPKKEAGLVGGGRFG